QGRPKLFHEILLLDSSGSTSGIPSKNLLKGIQGFTNVRNDCASANRITNITFDHRRNYAYLNKEIKNIDITKIPFTNGQTDFKLYLI
ncbi:unnamed protein product, partial [Didymodactylos carnosus]